MASKDEVRKYIYKKRQELYCKTKEQYNISILNKVVNSDEVEAATVIFIYVSFEAEVDTKKIINYLLNQGKIVLVPKVLSKELGMIAVRINSMEELSQGYFGVLEPNSTLKFHEKNIDLILLPGVAFDKQGGRVGYGGGFYDRFLKLVSKKCKKIGLAYSFQVLAEVPMQETDIYLDGIITE